MLAFLLHLILVLACAYAASVWLPHERPVLAAAQEMAAMDGVEGVLVGPLTNWDGRWYTLIAERGYRPYRRSAAFWPLYPLLLHLGHQFTGLSIPLVGVLLSNTAFLFALGLLHRLVRLDHGAAVARRTIWLLAFFPTAFYFSAVYTESLFLLLTVAAIYAARTGRWGWAALAGSLAALTRNTGVLLLLPLGLLVVQRYGWNPKYWWTRGLQLAAIALTPLVFLAHLGQVRRNPLLTFQVQEEWQRHFAWPWTTLADTVEPFMSYYRPWLTSCLPQLGPAHVHTCLITLNTRPAPYVDLLGLGTILIFIPLAAYTLLRVRPVYSLYALVGLLVPLFSPSSESALMSLPRFVSVLFPFFIALALLLRNRWCFSAVLVASAVLGAGLLLLFGTWNFLG